MTTAIIDKPPVLVDGFGSTDEEKLFVAEFGNKWESKIKPGWFLISSCSRNIVATIGVFGHMDIHLHGCSIEEFMLHYETMGSFRAPDVVFMPNPDHDHICQTFNEKIKLLNLYEG